MSKRPNEATLREALAEYAHSAWSGWMKYLFSQCTDENERGQVIVPAEMVRRWKRQMETDYLVLPEAEKESDRAEADKMIAILKRFEDE